MVRKGAARAAKNHSSLSLSVLSKQVFENPKTLTANIDKSPDGPAITDGARVAPTNTGKYPANIIGHREAPANIIGHREAPAITERAREAPANTGNGPASIVGHQRPPANVNIVQAITGNAREASETTGNPLTNVNSPREDRVITGNALAASASSIPSSQAQVTTISSSTTSNSALTTSISNPASSAQQNLSSLSPVNPNQPSAQPIPSNPSSVPSISNSTIAESSHLPTRPLTCTLENHARLMESEWPPLQASVVRGSMGETTGSLMASSSSRGQREVPTDNGEAREETQENSNNLGRNERASGRRMTWAERLSNRSKGMALTTMSVEDEVVIKEDDFSSELEYWKNTLVGTFLGARPSLATVTLFVEQAWNKVTKPDVLYFKRGWFYFRFKSQEDCNTILHGAPG